MPARMARRHLTPWLLMWWTAATLEGKIFLHAIHAALVTLPSSSNAIKMKRSHSLGARCLAEMCMPMPAGLEHAKASPGWHIGQIARPSSLATMDADGERRQSLMDCTLGGHTEIGVSNKE